MDDDELELHLAAGTDLATAFAAVQEDRPTKQGNRRWLNIGLLVGLAIVVAYWLLK